MAKIGLGKKPKTDRMALFTGLLAESGQPSDVIGFFNPP
jgi:hypothetical protein